MRLLRGLGAAVPAYLLNGASVALGVAIVQLAFSALASGSAGQAATTGAVVASLPHLADRAGRTGRRVIAGGVVGTVAQLVVLSSRGSVMASGAAIASIAFAAMMAMAWGKRAAPISFSAVIAMVFSLALPTSTPILPTVEHSLAGALAYTVFAVLANRVLAKRFRTLSVAEALSKASSLLEVRALEVGGRAHVARPELRGELVKSETALAEALQASRDLVFFGPDSERGRRETEILIRLIELRDALLASRLDLELLGSDERAREARRQLAQALGSIGRSLRMASTLIRGRDARPPRAPASVSLDAALLDPGRSDPLGRRERLWPVVVRRLERLAEEVHRIEDLAAGASPEALGSRDDLRRFASDDSWPLSTLKKNLTPGSSTFRHALRTAVALTTVFFAARALPWGSHPHWLVLTVAVVLRGTLDQTLARRNGRVAGTAIGCAVVMVLAGAVPDAVLRVVFFAAVGAAHAFVGIRYLLTAASAAVMALLQAHFASPELRFVAIERLVDTVLGALFAYGFSYVLPSWERRTLPESVRRALDEMRDYALATLSLDPRAEVEQRLARQSAYDALSEVAASLERSTVEPRRVRPPREPLVAFLDHAQILMAHLSSLRFSIARRREQLALPEAQEAIAAARDALDEMLGPGRAIVEAPRPPSYPEIELPSELPDARALPWVLRRLDLTVREGATVGARGVEALEHLRRSSLR